MTIDPGYIISFKNKMILYNKMIEWKIIPNTNNKYKISNNGNIYSNFRKIILKSQINKKNGLYIQNLQINKKRKVFYIHKLVFELFNKQVLNNQYVYHIDGNILNNNINNLSLQNRNENKFIYDPPLLSTEKWIDINNYIGRYKVSSLGRIYSIVSNKLLKPTINNTGYKQLKLIDKNGKRISYMIHRLVADNFIRKIEENKVVDHIDRNKLNNKLENLRIVSITKNNKNKNKSKTLIEQYDKKNNLIQTFSSMTDIITTYNLKGSSSIYACLNNRCKTSHGYIWKYKNNNNIIINDNNFYPIGIINEFNFYRHEINKSGQVRIINTKKILKAHISGDYKSINLRYKNLNNYMRIHRILAYLFIPNTIKEYNIVNHIDEDKLNNNLNNLEWCTHKENVTHTSGKKIKQININTNEVIKIFDSVNEAFRKLNKQYGNNIRLACNGERKSAFGYKWEWY